MAKKTTEQPINFSEDEVTNLPQREHVDAEVYLKNANEITVENTIQIANYDLADILPDYYQTRGELLPNKINFLLQTGKITHQQAIQMWEEQVQKEGGDTEWDNLLKLAEDIRKDGLLHPIQIFLRQGTRKYIIIDGERRYWAFWLLEIETDNYRSIPAQLKPSHSIRIQVTANNDVEALSSIGKARQYARLFLDKLGIQPDIPKTPEDYWEYYQKSMLSPDQLTGKGKLPTGFWDYMLEATGAQRQAITYYLQVFKLSPKSLYLAHKANTSINALSEILKAPTDKQEEILDLAIKFTQPFPIIEELVKLSNSLNKEAYNRLLSEIARPAEKTITQGQNTDKGKRREPMEAQYVKSLSFIRGIKKTTGGDYRAVARLIVGNQPEEAKTLADEYRRLADAIDSEIKDPLSGAGS